MSKEDLGLETRIATFQARAATSGMCLGRSTRGFPGVPEPIQGSGSLATLFSSSGVHQNHLCLVKHRLLGSTPKVIDSVGLV